MLENKVALVTGASRGIGREIALTLAKKGATVIVNYMGSEEKAREVAALICENGGTAEIYGCDVSDFEQCGIMIGDIIKKYGRLDILVNNAGITRDGLLMKMSEEDFSRVLDVNLKGAFNRIIAKSKIENQSEITLELAEDALKDIINPDKPKEITPTLIIEVVAEHFGVAAEDITSKKRNSEFVLPRQVFMYLCRKLTDTSYVNIAKLIGKKDHTTIIHGVNKIEDELAANEELRSKVETIKKKICV